MAWGGGRAAEFEEARRAYQRAISQELEEAARLMNELNKNLSFWAQKTGEVEKLAQVWSTFQNRLATVTTTLAHVNQQPDHSQI
ncbi:uncharacterized protein [Narcine bancroftii]|uniref:uncharacterized protein isoform X2 n=1 Tax=Narcine bancroftii TaxID=1343680 RepID=UPI003831F5BD